MHDLDPSHVQFTVGFMLLWESNATAYLREGGVQEVMQAIGSSCKYRWSFAHSPAAHLLLWGPVPNSHGPVQVHGPGVEDSCFMAFSPFFVFPESNLASWITLNWHMSFIYFDLGQLLSFSLAWCNTSWYWTCTGQFFPRMSFNLVLSEVSS